MGNFKDTIVKSVYYKIRGNTLSESVIFTTIEMYIKKPLTEKQKTLIREYANKIKNGEMSFEEYWKLYQSKIRMYEKNV